MTEEKHKDFLSKPSFAEYQEDKLECEIRITEAVDSFLKKYNVMIQEIKPVVVIGFGDQTNEVDGMIMIVN